MTPARNWAFDYISVFVAMLAGRYIYADMSLPTACWCGATGFALVYLCRVIFMGSRHLLEWARGGKF